MATGRVPDDHRPHRVNGVPEGERQRKHHARPDVIERAGKATTGFPGAPVFQIAGCDAVVGEGLREMPEI